MKNYLIDSKQFILLAIFWIVLGIYGSVAIYFILPITIFLLKKKRMYDELLIGFFLILILSDSRQPGLAFAGKVKDIYLLLLTLFIFFSKKDFKNIIKLYQPFLLFFLVASICLINSESFLTSLQKTASYFLLLFVVTNYVYKLIEKNAEQFLSKLIFFGTLLLMVGLVMKGIAPAKVNFEGRFSGILGNPNGLGIFSFLFFLVFSIIDYYYQQLFTRTEKIIIYLAITASIVLSGCRSAIFSVLIFLFFRYLYKMSPFLGFIIFLAILMAYQYLSLNLSNIIIGLGLQEYFRIETLEDGSGRFIAWNFAWENIQKNLFLGKGFSYTELLYKENYSFLSREGHQGNAHNSFLTFWLDTGLVGVVLYLIAFLSSFIRAAKQSYLAIPILYAILFSANFESWLVGSLNPITIQVWIILTILLFAKPQKQVLLENR